MKLLSERKTKDDKINSLEVQNDILNMEGSLLRQRQQRKSTNKLENKMVSRKLEEVAEILDMRSVLSRKPSEATLSNTDDESPVPTMQQSGSILSDTQDCLDSRTNSVTTLKTDETDYNNVVQHMTNDKLVQIQEQMQQDTIMQQTTMENIEQMQLRSHHDYTIQQTAIEKLVKMQEKMQQDITIQHATIGKLVLLQEKMQQDIEQMKEKIQQDLNDFKYMLSNSEL